MGLWTTAENAEATEVEIEQIEVVALVTLDETTGKHNLEHIAPQAMPYATANVGLVFLVGKRRAHFAHGMEVVLLDIRLVHGAEDAFQISLTAKRNHRKPVVEMVEDNQVAEQDVEHIGRIVLLLRLVLYRDVLEIAHGIERGVAVETTELGVRACYFNMVDERVDGFGTAETCTQLTLHLGSIRIADGGHAMTNGHRGNGIDANERARVVLCVIVAALHECTLGIKVAQTHVDTYWRIEIGQYGTTDG